MTQPAVRIENVTKRFGDQVAVEKLSLEIPSGSFFSIIGPSGCGKTTTLRMLAGFEQPDAGLIEVNGSDVTRTPAYRRPVNTVFQSYALFPHLNVFENVAFGLREERRPKQEIEQRVQEMIELVRLAGRELARPSELSGGQQQRVALGRALVKQPSVLLLDEPLGALDLKLRKELQDELRETQRNVGITFVYVTHDQEEAFSMSDQVAVMNEGLLEQVGSPEEIYRQPASQFVADFVGQSNRFSGQLTTRNGSLWSVKLDDGAFLNALAPDSAAEGAMASVIVRPENVRIGEAGGFAATITSATYLGPSRTVRLDAGALGSILATVHDASRALTIGSSTTVSWHESDAWVIL